jgi:predicted short-subunit dehydrogenase-like oxidoreductase (DUF2520 family)
MDGYPDVMSEEFEKPFRPLLIGRGRLARHLHHLLTLREIPHSIHEEARQLLSPNTIDDPCFREEASLCTHIWLLVSDQALLPLSRMLREQLPCTPLLHSSAATPVPDAVTLHPLMTFGPALYEEETYDRIPLTLFREELEHSPRTADRLQLEGFLSRLANPVRILSSAERTRYHLSCVMYSNLSLLLWEAARRSAPPSLSVRDFEPILLQTLLNFFDSGLSALTGPLARGDTPTIEAHLGALATGPERELYDAFVRYFENRKKEAPHADHRP